MNEITHTYRRRLCPHVDKNEKYQTHCSSECELYFQNKPYYSFWLRKPFIYLTNSLNVDWDATRKLNSDGNGFFQEKFICWFGRQL